MEESVYSDLQLQRVRVCNGEEVWAADSQIRKLNYICNQTEERADWKWAETNYLQ